MTTDTRDQDAFMLKTGIGPDDFRRLRRIPLFAGLKPEDLRVLLATSFLRTYADQTTLFMEGEPAACFYIVMDGWVKLYRVGEDGHEMVVSVVSPGESFAEAAIFDSHVYPVNAAAISDTRLLMVRADNLLLQLRENSHFAINMLGSMSRHLRSHITLLYQLSALSSTERLANFLLGLTNGCQGEVTITLPLDKALIAARLGMQPETFSRALAKLKSAGVKSSGYEIVIKDVTALKASLNRTSIGGC